jgi:hypothetical protein
MKAVQSTAAIEIGYENLPRWNGSSYESIRVDDAQGDGNSYDRIIRGKEKGI